MTTSLPRSGPPLNAREKGVPWNVTSVRLEEVPGLNWNILREDIPLPAAVLSIDAMRHNSEWMQNFLASSGASIAPHGKTTMSPELFEMQLSDGAWAITVSTPHQLQVARSFGVQRIFYANQLIGKSPIEYVVKELARDPQFEFYCLIDSFNNAAQIANCATAAKQSVRVLVELGFSGGRTGCRSVQEALALARAVKHFDGLTLSGIEGFEGIIRGKTYEDTLSRVNGFLDEFVTLVEHCEAEHLFTTPPVLLSAGGSAFFDLVVAKLRQITTLSEKIILLRSGCYLTHDSVMYRRLLEQLQARTSSSSGLIPALEVWGYVQSLPEPGRAIVAIGKRDISYDDLPVAEKWFRPGVMQLPQAVPPDHRVLRLNDQHCYVDIPPNSRWQIGDMIGFGISHPCLTFDKWRVLHLVDEEYTVVGSVRTYF